MDDAERPSSVSVRAVRVVERLQHLRDDEQRVGGRQAFSAGDVRSRCRSTPSTNSMARKNSFASVRPKSNTCTTLACDSCIARRTSSKKRATNSDPRWTRYGCVERDALRDPGLRHRAGGDDLRHPALGNQTADVVAPDQLGHAHDYIAGALRAQSIAANRRDSVFSASTLSDRQVSVPFAVTHNFSGLRR